MDGPGTLYSAPTMSWDGHMFGQLGQSLTHCVNTTDRYTPRSKIIMFMVYGYMGLIFGKIGNVLIPYSSFKNHQH